MNIEEAIHDYLMDQTGLTALISDRLYYNDPPASPTAPYVVFSRISSTPEISHDGDSGISFSQLQFSVFDDAYNDAKDIVEQLFIALHCKKGLIGDEPGVWLGSSFKVDEADEYDDSSSLHRITIDFTMCHE